MRPDSSFVAQPVRSLQTMLRLIGKNDPRFPTPVPDGIYGPETMNAVAAFQRLVGLPVTGVVNQTTWDAIVENYLPARVRQEKAVPIEILLEPGQVITAGQTSPYVYLAQGMLAYISDTNPAIPAPSHSGQLDPETVAALLAFQQITALEPTGELDRLAWAQLAQYFTLNVHIFERSNGNSL